MLHQLRLIAEALPWTLPALVGGGVLGLVTMLLFPTRRSRSDRIGFALVVWALVLALAVTLSPVRNAYFGIPTLGCNLQVWKPLDYHYWFSAGSRPPNVWLLLPAGIGAMLLDGVWRRFLAVGFFLALPPGIEAIQKFYPELKRSCSSQDIVDNWTGLLIGLAVGMVLMVFIGLARLIRRRSERKRRAGVGSDEWHSDGPRDAGAHRPDGPLPLGGGRSGGYSDFGDFDDSPNSTRWWSEREQAETRAMPYPPQHEHRDEARTQEVRQHDVAYQREDAQAWPADEVDATQVMPTRRRSGGASSYSGRAGEAGGHSSDETQIIPRG